MQSHTILAPKGWKVEGGAWWPNSKFFKIYPSQNIKVTSPDGVMVWLAPSLAAVDVRPSQQSIQYGNRRPAEFTPSNGAPVIYLPDNMQQWQQFVLEKSIKIEHPKATNIKQPQVAIVPELTTVLKRQIAPIARSYAQQNQQNRALGMNMFSFADAAMLGVSVEFDENGQTWEQLMVFGVVYFGVDSEFGRNLWWAIEPNYVFKAPKGKLESHMPLLMSIGNSLRPTPQWAKMKRDHIAKINQIQRKGAADRAAIMRNSSSEINDIIHKGWKNREAIRDNTHRKVINTIRGTEDFTSSHGTITQLPNTHNHVFTNGAGEVIMTNNANYNPNSDPNVTSTNWEQMKPVP